MNRPQGFLATAALIGTITIAPAQAAENTEKASKLGGGMPLQGEVQACVSQLIDGPTAKIQRDEPGLLIATSTYREQVFRVTIAPNFFEALQYPLSLHNAQGPAPEGSPHYVRVEEQVTVDNFNSKHWQAVDLAFCQSRGERPPLHKEQRDPVAPRPAPGNFMS